MAHSPPLPGKEGAGTAMVGRWVAFYGMRCVEKMLCGRQRAVCVAGGAFPSCAANTVGRRSFG